MFVLSVMFLNFSSQYKEVYSVSEDKNFRYLMIKQPDNNMEDDGKKIKRIINKRYR